MHMHERIYSNGHSTPSMYAYLINKNHTPHHTPYYLVIKNVYYVHANFLSKSIQKFK